MTTLIVHPTTRLILWSFLLVAVQNLTGNGLAVATLSLPIFGIRILRRAGKLVWRIRWLMISLLFIFAWGVAGDPLWEAGYAPTHEGLAEGFVRLGRLLMALVVIAGVIETMPLPDLLSAIHAMLKPLRGLGLNPDRGLVRLMLVLRYVETLPHPREWKTLLDVPESNVQELIEVNYDPLGWLDYMLMFFALLAVLSFYFL